MCKQSFLLMITSILQVSLFNLYNLLILLPNCHLFAGRLEIVLQHFRRLSRGSQPGNSTVPSPSGQRFPVEMAVVSGYQDMRTAFADGFQEPFVVFLIQLAVVESPAPAGAPQVGRIQVNQALGIVVPLHKAHG